MSLLLDALKRAEQEKQARQGERPAPSPAPAKAALELAPLASNEPATVMPRPSATAASASPPRAAAPAASRKTALWAAGIAIGLAVLGGAGYVWYSISALAPATSARAPAIRPIASAPVAPPAVEAPAAKKAELPPELSAAPIAAAQPTAEKRPATPHPAPAPSPQPAAGVLQPSPIADRPRIAPEVSRGYAALRAGDLDTARREYGVALANESSNVDAALGLATVEARSGHDDAAANLYRRALDSDPRNAAALAGLAALSNAPRGEAQEQQLQRQIAQHPSSAALHLLLGNVYAAQSLWTQAQASYFEAHRLDPQNPDILYNLAVSIDRLGQSKVAAGFYSRALAAARTQAAQFDATAASRRLAEIEGAK